MARTARNVVPRAPHHLIARGNNRRRLFSSVTDRLTWLTCLDRGLRASGCLLHQLTLMTNHVHMIVTPPTSGALAHLMKRACQRYAQRRNELRGSSGKLFEERYRSEPIEDEAHMMMATLYNDANAFRSGLVADPLEHEWSTGPLHAGRAGSRVARLWTPSPWYLGLAASASGRASRYAQIMAAYARVSSGVDEPGAYTRRVERPNGTSAREGALRWR